MSLVLLTIIGVAIVPSLALAIMNPDIIASPMKSFAAPLMPLVLFVVANQLVASDAGQKLMELRPPELQFVLAGPFRPSQILTYRLTILGFNWTLMSLFFIVVLLSHFESVAGGYLGILLGGSFIFSLSFLRALVTPRLTPSTIHSFRIGLRLLLLAILAEVAFLASRSPQSFTPEGISSLLGSSYLASVLGYPFRPFAYLLQCKIGWALVANALIGGLMVVASIACCYRFNDGFSELAVEGVARSKERKARIRGGNLYAIKPKGTSTITRVPEFGWWAGAGPVAWTQVAMILRRTGYLIPGILTLGLFGSIGIFVAIGSGVFTMSPQMQSSSFLIAMGIGTYVSFLILMTTQLGFSMNQSLLTWYQMLPIGPLPIGIGMIAGNLVILFSIRLGFSLVGWSLSDQSWTDNLIYALGFTAIDVSMASVLNLISAATALRIQSSGTPDIFQGARAMVFMLAAAAAMTPIVLIGVLGAAIGGGILGFAVAPCVLTASLTVFAMMPLIWWLTGHRFLSRELTTD